MLYCARYIDLQKLTTAHLPLQFQMHTEESLRSQKVTLALTDQHYSLQLGFEQLSFSSFLPRPRMRERAENSNFSTPCNSFTTTVALEMGQMCTNVQTKREKANMWDIWRQKEWNLIIDAFVTFCFPPHPRVLLLGGLVSFSHGLLLFQMRPVIIGD